MFVVELPNLMSSKCTTPSVFYLEKQSPVYKQKKIMIILQSMVYPWKYAGNTNYFVVKLVLCARYELLLPHLTCLFCCLVFVLHTSQLTLLS